MSTPIQIQFRDDNIIITHIETSDKPFVQPDRTDPNIIVFDGYKNIFGNVERLSKFYQRITKYYIMSNGNHFTTISYD